MENVINRILEIDEKARMMIAEAEKKKQNILNEAHENEQQVKDNFVNKSQEKISKVDEVHKLESNEQIAGIENEKRLKIEKLDKLYADKHAEWEAQILKSIVG